jgi:hypothetical protein
MKPLDAIGGLLDVALTQSLRVSLGQWKVKRSVIFTRSNQHIHGSSLFLFSQFFLPSDTFSLFLSFSLSLFLSFSLSLFLSFSLSLFLSFSLLVLSFLLFRFFSVSFFFF